QRAAVRDPPGVLVDDLAQRGAHGELVDSGAHDVARDTVELRARALLRPDTAEPLGSAPDDARDAGERLDVVHDDRPAEQAGHRWNRRLDPRVAALSLERLEQAGLLAADVGAGTAVDHHLEVEARAEDVLPEEPLRLCFAYRLPEPLVADQHLAPDVD